MTEASPGVLMAVPPTEAAHALSAGVPHFFTDIAVALVARNTSEGSAAAPGNAGELLVRGLNVFRGYWDRPEDTRRSLSGGWYRSGDVLHFDDNGWAYVTGRVGDLIISGGENIYPAEVEDAINALPGVTTSAVIGYPDQCWGEVGLAFVVAEEDGWSAESLREALTGSLAGFKIPRYIRFVASLPTTATGKVRRDELRTAAGLRATPSTGGAQ